MTLAKALLMLGTQRLQPAQVGFAEGGQRSGLLACSDQPLGDTPANRGQRLASDAAVLFFDGRFFRHRLRRWFRGRYR